jgi:hypothetical protein
VSYTSRCNLHRVLSALVMPGLGKLTFASATEVLCCRLMAVPSGISMKVPEDVTCRKALRVSTVRTKPTAKESTARSLVLCVDILKPSMISAKKVLRFLSRSATRSSTTLPIGLFMTTISRARRNCSRRAIGSSWLRPPEDAIGSRYWRGLPGYLLIGITNLRPR